MLIDYIRMRIREDRKRLGYSTADFAAEVGMDERTLRRLETGVKKDISVSQLVLIAEKLGKRVQEFMPVEFLDYVQQHAEEPGDINRVISIADAVRFFRSIYEDTLAQRNKMIDELHQHCRSQDHIITAITGELEELRNEVRRLRQRFPAKAVVASYQADNT